MSTTPYSVEIVATNEAFALLRNDWERLCRGAAQPSVFSSYAWFDAWYTHFAEQDRNLELYALVLRRDDIVTGIAPLLANVPHKFGVSLRRLHFASRDHEWDYNDLIVGNDIPAQAAALARHLSATAHDWDFIDLHDLREPGESLAVITEPLEAAGLFCRVLPEEERSPFLPIYEPWDEQVRRHSRSTRRVLQRFAQSAQEGFESRIIDDPSLEPDLLEKMVALEAQKHVAGQPSIPFLGRYKDLFQSLFKSLGPQRSILIMAVEHRGRLIAWQLFFRCGKKLWGYLTAYDHAFESLSLGTVLTAASIDYAFANGYDELDFLNGEEPYKLRWATGFHNTFRLVIWNRRWKSRLYAHLKLRHVSAVERK